MPTLLEIGDDLAAFQELLDEHDGELTPDVEAALEAWFSELGEARDQKLDNYAALVRSAEMRASVRREEMERLQRRVKTDEALAARLKDRLKLFLGMAKVDRVETKRYTIRVQANGGQPPMEVLTPEFLPEEFQVIERKPNMARVREALANGINVAGVRIMPRGNHLRIT